MNLREHEDNQFTKETNEIESYLIRIVQRYFDIENNYTRESIEAIINESLTRFKRDVLSKSNFLFSLNEKTGNIALTINDIGGEITFEKQSAFNKDFGAQADTICQGNDTRLTDYRTPTEHVHEIEQMTNLTQRINDLIVSNDLHIHDNRNVLNMLEYSGIQTKIDLAVIEHLQQVVEDYYNNLIFRQSEENEIHQNAMDTLIMTLFNTRRLLNHAREIVLNAGNWLKYSKEYTKNLIPKLRDDIHIQLLQYVDTSTADELKELVKKVPFEILTGEISIPIGTITCTSPVTGITHASEHVTVTHSIAAMPTGIHNKNIKLYFRYESGGKIIDAPLPFVHYVAKDKMVCVTGHYSDAGNLVIESNFINVVPAYVTNADFYNDIIIICNHSSLDTFYMTGQKIVEMGCKLCKIDSTAKNNFVNTVAVSGKTYWIEGTRSFIDGVFYDKEHQPLTYFNWGSGSPSATEEKVNIIFKDNKWSNIESDKEYGYIAEYDFKHLTDYFTNPRIYYRVLGTREVV